MNLFFVLFKRKIWINQQFKMAASLKQQQEAQEWSNLNGNESTAVIW